MEEENKNIEKIEEETNTNKSRLDNDNSKEQIGKLENIRDNTEKITSGLAEETNIYRLKEKQLIENLQNDRMLKTETLNFVRHIIWANIICTFAIITIVLFANLRFDKQVIQRAIFRRFARLSINSRSACRFENNSKAFIPR